MKWNELGAQQCSIARSVAMVGDRWTLLILRDCFLGVRRFEGFEQRLGISRGIIASRLKKLTEAGLLVKRRYLERPARHEYWLTAKGAALQPVMMALLSWGDRYCPDERGPAVRLTHLSCGCEFQMSPCCSACGGVLSPHSVVATPSLTTVAGARGQDLRAAAEDPAEAPRQAPPLRGAGPAAAGQ